MQLLPIPETREEFWKIIRNNKGLQAVYMGSVISILPVPSTNLYELYINGVKSSLVSGSMNFNWRLACWIVNDIEENNAVRKFSEFYYYPENVLNSIDENQYPGVVIEKQRRQELLLQKN